jgi:hypothetical protein
MKNGSMEQECGRTEAGSDSDESEVTDRLNKHGCLPARKDLAFIENDQYFHMASRIRDAELTYQQRDE